MNFGAALFAIEEFTAFGLAVALFDAIGQRLACFIGETLFRILDLEGAAENLFRAVVVAAGKPLVDERFEVGRNLEVHGKPLCSSHRALKPAGRMEWIE